MGEAQAGQDQGTQAHSDGGLELFALPTATSGLPRVFGGPRRYVQARGVIGQAGAYLLKMGFHSCAVLLSQRSQQAEGAQLLGGLESAGVTASILSFGGECSFEEIERHARATREGGVPDVLIALGGGKVVDAGKSIADRLGVPTVVVPSLASNDAPCSAVSVIYTPEGVTETFEVFAENPALVLVDTEVIARAPARYLVAGMGDAMATWYEARACSFNPHAINSFGASPTAAGTAIAELCARIIYEQGEAALAAVAEGRIDASLEQVIEANTLLSGVGFECGGLAASHGFAQAYTVLPSVHAGFLHGEMVAMGVLAQLALEQWHEELERAAEFFARIGLPVHLGQLGLEADDSAPLTAVAEAAAAFPFMANMTVECGAPALLEAMRTADTLGRQVAEAVGEEAYLALRA